MPITYRIDHERRLVDTTVVGVLTSPEIFAYQREVWSRPEVAGYDELVDMGDATLDEFVSHELVSWLAELSASMDTPSPSRFAIVASEDLHFGLGRMYERMREMKPGSTKAVGVFRTRPEALEWLGLANAAVNDNGGAAAAERDAAS